MEHRGATGYESNTGDGAGIQIQIPHELLDEEASTYGIDLPRLGDYGVGMFFFPKNVALIDECKNIIQHAADRMELNILGYRPVPVNNIELGELAKEVEPVMEMIFIEKPFGIDDENSFERKLFVFRNYISNQINNVLQTIPLVLCSFAFM